MRKAKKKKAAPKKKTTKRKVVKVRKGAKAWTAAEVVYIPVGVGAPA